MEQRWQVIAHGRDSFQLIGEASSTRIRVSLDSPSRPTELAGSVIDHDRDTSYWGGELSVQWRVRLPASASALAATGEGTLRHRRFHGRADLTLRPANGGQAEIVIGMRVQARGLLRLIAPVVAPVAKVAIRRGMQQAIDKATTRIAVGRGREPAARQAVARTAGRRHRQLLARNLGRKVATRP